MNNCNVLEIKALKAHLFTYEGVARAVDGVIYQLAKGEPLAAIGESDCGKSVAAVSVLRPIIAYDLAVVEHVFDRIADRYREWSLCGLPRRNELRKTGGAIKLHETAREQLNGKTGSIIFRTT